MHPHLNSFVIYGRDSQQLDGVAKLAGVLKVAGRQPGYALVIDVRIPDPGSETQAGQDGQLVGGVYALNVVGGIGLCVSETLCLG